MNLLDVTIVNVALPSMQRDFNAGSGQIEWVVAGYVLAFALCLLPFGRYGDVKGKRRVFLLGVAGFSLASAFCGIATSVEMLIVARMVQGAAGAMMTPQVLAIAQVMFPPHERAAAFSLFGLSAGLASVAGPIIGGWLIGMNFFDLGWRPIFLINIPLGMIAILAGWRLIPHVPVRKGLRNDYVGIVLVGLGIFFVIFPLIGGHGYGWPLWTHAMMMGSLFFFVGFYLWQRHQHRVGGPELLPLTLMSNRNYVIGALMTAVFFSTLPGFFLILAMFLQEGFALTPLQSGMTTVPFSVGVLVASVISGRLGRVPPRLRIMVGMMMLTVGMALLRTHILHLTDTIDPLALLPSLLLSGLGMGIAIAPMFQVALAGVPPEDAGSGSGALQAIQQVGSVFGIAIVSALFFGSLAANEALSLASGEAHADSLATGMVYNFLAYGLVLIALALLRPAQGAARTH
ncbi:MFS transporter [Peteryoungia desertarenae]|nr:MFS transporter [Peteryoungia desertarenae]